LISFGGEPISTNSPQTAIPFGKYLLIKRLAVGGMAELFLAQQPPQAELVVLKRILPYLSEEPEFVQMFLDEAKIAAQLHHPNIVQVHELGKLDNTIFIAMEFVEGIDLRRVMQEESKFGATVPYGVAAAICAQVAAGLDYAHNSVAVDGRPLDLIHRDVSPQNVMIAYDGRVKLVDFGIAKAGAFIDARSKPGVIKGKFLYLSPEQVAQLTLDRRADIFALGTMMYEITTGKSPFAKPTTEGILYAIRSEDPSPPHLIRDDYPQELSRIIMRCLVKDRDLRYQRAAEVHDDLQAFIHSGALKQSTDIADYIARLMGEEEERTVLHIPIAAPAGRKDATLPMPAGLAARPSRRPTGEDVASLDYNAEPEPPTQTSRAREMLSATRSERMDRVTGSDRIQVSSDVPELDSEEAQDFAPDPEAQQIEDAINQARDEAPEFEEEEEEATAIGTLPVGFQRPEPGESTVAQRGKGRAPTAPSVPAVTTGQRRSNPAALDQDTEPRARRPATPPTRRPLVESSPSISLTQPTLNQRGRGDQEEEDNDFEALTPATLSNRPLSRQFSAPLARMDDSLVDTETGAGEGERTDSTHAYRGEPEDDESTAGYENEPGAPAKRGSTGLWLAVAAVVLLIVLGGGAFWALSSSPNQPDELVDPSLPGPLDEPLPPVDTTAEKLPENPEPQPNPIAEVQPTEPGSEVTPPANPPGGDNTNPGGTEPGTPNPTPPVTATDTDPDVVEVSPHTVVALPPPEPIEPESVAVKFKTTSTTAIIWVNGRKIEPNKILNLAPGTIRVRFVCSSHKRPNRGSFVHTLKLGATEPKELAIPCKKGQR
jgi:serine/threonine protein kinase